MIKSSPVISLPLLAMMIFSPISLLRISSAYGLQPLSKILWMGPPGATRSPFFSYQNMGGALAFSNTRLGMSSISPDPAAVMLQLSIPTAEELEEVGALLAVISSPPDVLFLDGDLGSGKTTLARGFVLCKLGLENDSHSMRVTSPTYLLSNTYRYKGEQSEKEQEIHHMDLYRLSGTSPNEFEPLELNRVFEQCISLVEWPSRLESQPQRLPSNKHRLDVTISIVPKSNTRLMKLTAPIGSTWNDRLQCLLDEGMVDDLLHDE